jgi:hypothetical protein
VTAVLAAASLARRRMRWLRKKQRSARTRRALANLTKNIAAWNVQRWRKLRICSAIAAIRAVRQKQTRKLQQTSVFIAPGASSSSPHRLREHSCSRPMFTAKRRVHAPFVRRRASAFRAHVLKESTQKSRRPTRGGPSREKSFRANARMALETLPQGRVYLTSQAESSPKTVETYAV